jgi:hypothetical protein
MCDFYRAKTAMKMAAAMRLLNANPFWDAELTMGVGVGVLDELLECTVTEAMVGTVWAV